MPNAIHLEPAQVPQHLRGSYSGKQFKAIVSESVTIPAFAGVWDGGSRDTFQVIRLSDGKALDASDNMTAPNNRDPKAHRTIAIPPGFAFVRHSISCGQDSGLTFYVHPSDAATLLPAPAAELNAHERIVLIATRSFKSSYAGKDRYQMAADEVRWDSEAKRAAFPTRPEWENAKAALIARGLLNKAGAITVAGKNAVGSVSLGKLF